MKPFEILLGEGLFRWDLLWGIPVASTVVCGLIGALLARKGNVPAIAGALMGGALGFFGGWIAGLTLAK